MRTTLSIQDNLLRQAKELSLRRGASLGEVVDDALRILLASQSKTAKEARIRPLKTFRGGGLQVGVELDSNSELLDRMEGR